MGTAAVALHGVVVLVHLDNILGTPKPGQSQGFPWLKAAGKTPGCMPLHAVGGMGKKQLPGAPSRGSSTHPVPTGSTAASRAQELSVTPHA